MASFGEMVKDWRPLTNACLPFLFPWPYSWKKEYSTNNLAMEFRREGLGERRRGFCSSMASISSRALLRSSMDMGSSFSSFPFSNSSIRARRRWISMISWGLDMDS